MKTIAVIPARGGSKRIPHKNIKNFCGKPIIAYSIEAAKKSQLFDKIIVSTDDEQIAEVARKHGAEIPFMRPKELADDFTGTDTVILHALNWIIKHGGEIQYVCCIYATAPFVNPKYLRIGFELLKNKVATSAFSVTTYPYPIYRSLKIDENDRLKMIWPDYLNVRSQDLSEAYHDAGQFYWADVKKYLAGRRFFSQDAVPVILPRHLVQDIDTDEDWKRAECMFEALNIDYIR
jgi:pseudaminic acid cytidylyltransferase